MRSSCFPLIIVIFITIGFAAVSAIVMYWHVAVTMKDKYRPLWEELFSGGTSNIKFWKWLSQNNYSEINDISFRKQLLITNRLWWFATSAIGVCILIGVIFVIWNMT